MSVVKVHRLAVVATTRLSWRSPLCCLPPLPTLSPALRVLSCGAPWMRAATISDPVKMRQSHDAFAAARRERDPNTVVSSR